MLPDDRIRVQHILEAIADARSFIAGHPRSELGTNRMRLFVLVRCVEIVGEAAGRISETTKRAAPDIPWTAIVGMRNRLIHAYFDVDADIVWKTVTDELPSLADALRALLADEI